MTETEKNAWAIALRFLRKRKRTGKADIAKLHQSLDQGLDIHADIVSMTPSVEKEEEKEQKSSTIDARISSPKNVFYQRNNNNNSGNKMKNCKMDRKPVLILKMVNSPTDSLLSPCSQMLWHKLQCSPKRYNKGFRCNNISSKENNCGGQINSKVINKERPSTPVGSNSIAKLISDEEKENIALTPVSRTKRTTLI